MQRTLSILTISFTLLGFGCGGAETESTTETTETTTEETAGGTDETMTTTAAGSFEVTSCTEFGYTPTDCQGSAENPSCHSSFELRPDGRVMKVFDDIMADGTYTIDGDQVTLSIPDMSYTETFTAEGDALVSSQGARYESTSCD